MMGVGEKERVRSYATKRELPVTLEISHERRWKKNKEQ